MALDEPRDDDDTFDIDGFSYIAEKTFLEKAQPIKVDYLINGFKLDCSINFQSACSTSGCGTSCCG